MIKNMGNTDRILRLIVAAVLLYLAFGTQYAATGLWHWVAIVVAAVFIITSLIGNCALYSIFGIRTCPRN